MNRYLILALAFMAMACSKDVNGIPGVDDARQLSYQATTSRSGDGDVETVVTVTNTTDDEVVAAIGGKTCQFSLLAYAEASRMGQPVWDEADWRREHGFGCTYEERLTRFSPGESATYETTVPVTDISTTAPTSGGRYYLVAAVHDHSGGIGEMKFIRIPAGDLQIKNQ